MNLFLTRNFLYCTIILCHIYFTKRVTCRNMKGKGIDDGEEEKFDVENRKQAEDEAKKNAKAHPENTVDEEDEDMLNISTIKFLKTSKMQLDKLESKIVKQKWCKRVLIEEVCPNTNVTFWLYNKYTPNGYHLNEHKEHSIMDAPFMKDAVIKILLHGYNGNKSYTPNSEIRSHYINRGHNVISVDYHKVVPRPCFIQAYNNIVRVAKCFSKFLLKLTSLPLVHTKVTLNDYHIIGFDIGAQVAGKAGLILSDQDTYLPRISSLDASLPIFFSFSNYISTKSAKFVDAIHTNVMIFSRTAAYGHCDFYVNKAITQGPCKLTDTECNHRMAAVFFGESVDSKLPFCGFNIIFRNKTATMGEYCEPTTKGVYLVTTNSKPPYARGCQEIDNVTNEDEEPATLIKVNKTMTVKI